MKKNKGFLLKSGNKDNAIRILYKIMEITLENLYFEIYGSDEREPPPPLSPYANEFFQTFVHDSVILVFSEILIKKSLAYPGKKIMIMIYSAYVRYLCILILQIFS